MAKCFFFLIPTKSPYLIITLNLILTFSSLVLAVVEITPPPRTPDNKPIVSNGIVYYLDYIPKRCQEPRVATFKFGGTVDRPMALMKKDNPHRIRKSIQISPKGCLFIEPGCRLEFSPGEGIIVNGTLIARGSEEDGGRITFTKDPESNVKPTETLRDDARLVDGNSSLDGRLELFYRNKWRGVCTNYVNFTELEANVTCRHLGFRNGNFTYHSFSWNYTEYLLFERPNCLGHENSLTECSGWANIKIGPHVCDGQQTIGFECEGLRPGVALDHWRGIEFYNSSTEEYIDDVTSTMLIASDSSIWFADIEYAGLDTFREGALGINHPYASLSASPHVPNLDNVTIRYGAYDAVNLTYILGNITIQNSTIHDNRGHGILIKSTIGKAMITKTSISNNWGDGIKYYTVNLTTQANYEDMFKRPYFFCRLPRIGIRRYPIYVPEQVVHDQDSIPIPGCQQVFETRKGMVLTLHFILLESDPNAIAELVVSNSRNGGVIKTVPIKNGSYPQSITSASSKLYVNFKLIRRGYCRFYKWCVRLLLLISSGNSTDVELHVTESNVFGNNQHGISVQDMRSKIIVNSTNICDNKYEAGLRVFQGAGHVVVNGSTIQNNQRAGINITYSGGLVLFNQSQILQNKGYGAFTEFLQLNRSRIEEGLKFEVVGVKFTENSWTALRIGNYCRGGNILVNESAFENNYREGIEYLSCNETTQLMTNFSLDLNTFKSNAKQGLLMAPLLNSLGRITNNTFVNHSMGGILINNGYDLLISRWYSNFPVEYEILTNIFTMNKGRYTVNLRLTQNSEFQRIFFKYNKLTNNEIVDSFPFLNPRSHANAVVVVSSDNIKVQRNEISNPESLREMSTQLTDPSVTITADYNYWGTDKYENFYNRIFDRDDRYNLAVISCFPALRNDRLYETYEILDPPPNLENNFLRGDILGGELKTKQSLKAKRYRVDKDIYIEPTGWLDIPAGAILEFDNSIGMVVYGTLVADGRQSQWVEFVLRDDFLSVVENMTFPVRLADGIDALEGRVEVEINGEWGTICNKGWTEQNSVVVCNQLGLIYNPQFSRAQLKQKTTSLNVVMSWVACSSDDADITKCKAQLLQDDPIDCNHDGDVYLRCQLATWSGVTIPAIPKGGLIKENQIRTLKIDKAGLLDHSKMFFSPALRIDYNYYDITNVTVTGSTSDGIYIRFNHPFSNNRLQYCNVFDGLGNGLVVKYPFLESAYGIYHGNKQSGFLYDPFFTEDEAMSVPNFMRSDQVTFLENSQEIKITSEMTMFKTRPRMNLGKQEFVYKFKSFDSQLTLQILNYNPLTNVEKLTISNKNQEYKIEEDLIDFPLVSTRGEFIVKLSVFGTVSGRLAFVLIKGGTSKVNPRIYLRNCTLSENEIGIVTKHYNHPSNDKQELYFRFKDEKIQFYLINVLKNSKMAMHVPSVTKYHDNFIPTYEELTKPQRVGTITYLVDDSKFIQNGRGIFAEHNHVEFANNVWHWNISSSHLNDNLEGGLEIELPRVNDVNERLYHAVVLTESVFKSNRDFSCKIQGYFATVTISKNVWRDNRCRLGLFDIMGMEKNVSITGNNFLDNICKYVINLDISSHFEYFDPIKGNFSFNNIRNNGPVSPVKNDGYPSTYALALKGLQNIVVNRNLFNNPKFQFEVIAGVMALSLSNVINVEENWWGKSDQIFIRKRIFDFDYWNNYAMAEYLPFLIEEKFDSQLSTEPKQEIVRDERELAGRIKKNLLLYPSDQPYEVISDVTVMPGVTLKIEPGTVLRFRPNVGILVLGTLQARGLVHSRIRMLPSLVSGSEQSPKVKRETKGGEVRLRGSLNKNEGFLEFFNSSSNKWNIMCDNKLNEKMAEVVCRQLGFETINVRIRFSHLYDYFIYGFTTYFTKEFWAYTYQCTGNEDTLNQCTKRINYQVMSCIRDEAYAFLQCGERNLEPMYNYWGNIRFSLSTFEEPVEKTDERSYLEYVDIHGAGILHGKKVGAIQSVYRTPIIRHINISGSALNGYDFVAPRNDLSIENQNISRNLGYAVNILVLNGDSREGQDSTFLPLIESTIPYYIFGLVEMCRMERDITLNTRMLLYYKYTSQAVNCVKSIRSHNPYKRIQLRFLQMNLYTEDFTRNVIEIFDGQTQIAELFGNSSKQEVLRLYSSTPPNALTVHIHASVADRKFGFIAEVVNELFGTTSESKNKHVIRKAAMELNEDGAIQYKNVGEVNPVLYVQFCSIMENGVKMLNMTSPPINHIALQRSRKLVLSNNFISRNHGGTWLQLETDSVSTAIEANITNNVFTYGTHGETLVISGHFYQTVFIRGNFFFNNTAGDYKNVILMVNIRVTFDSNYLGGNTGHHILAAYAGENTEVLQLYTKNTFKDNNSTALYESTIKVGSGMPRFVNNYLVNPENPFELESNIVAKFAGGSKPINATENWWGSKEDTFIQGKIRDYMNNESLASVKYRPYKISIWSVTEGECPPGWSLNDKRCYRYFGGVQNYYQAVNYCNELGGNLGTVKGKELFFQKLIFDTENYYNLKDRVWVYEPLSPGLCSVFVGDFFSTENDCHHLLYPFICEKDPVITAASVNLAVVISASVFSLLVIVIIVVSAFWIFKSKQRKEERFERRNSLRSSVRSRSQLTVLSSHQSKLNYLDTRSNISDNYIIGHHPMDADSVISAKSKCNSFITDATEITPNSTLGRNHRNNNNNIQMVDYDDYEPSFTEDEESIASDVQTEPNPRTHRNTDIMNAVWYDCSKSDDIIYSNVPFDNQNRKASKNSLDSEVPSEPFANDQRPILPGSKRAQVPADEPPAPPPPLENYKPSKRLLTLTKNLNKQPTAAKQGASDSFPRNVLPKELQQQPKDTYLERLAENRQASPALSVKSRENSYDDMNDILVAADRCVPPPLQLSTFPSQGDISHGKDSPDRQYPDSYSQDLDPGIGYLQRSTYERGSRDRIDSRHPNVRSQSPYNFHSSRENLHENHAPVPRPKPVSRPIRTPQGSQENLSDDRHYQPSPRGSRNDLSESGRTYKQRPPVSQKPVPASRPKHPRRPPQNVQTLETEIL